MTVARTIQALGEVTRPPCVTDISLAEGAISKWEEMLKKVDRDFKQTIGDHMRIAKLANFMPLVIKEYIYVNVQPDTQYKVIIDKVKTLIRNKVTTGAVPMDIGHVQAGERDCAEDESKGCPGEHYDVDALGFRGRCNNCGGWGHFARECPSKGHGKGGKGDAGGKTGVWVKKVDVVGEKLTRLSAMTFNEADVKKPLASAVEIAKAGNRIVLQADGGYIENAKTGEKMKVDVDKNVYVYQVQMDDGEMIAVTLDSGAGSNVWPRGLKAGSSILKPPKKGLKMIAANGTPISNFGQRLVKFRGLDANNGFSQADVSMIEREGDRNALNVVRPDGGHFPRGVCDENVSLEQDGQENVEMTMELRGEEFGERKPKKVQDPKLPSPEEVLEHNFSH